MANICLTDLTEALDGFMTESEVKQLKTRIHDEALARQRNNIQSREDALRDVSEELISEREAEKIRDRKRSLISIIKLKEVSSNVDRFTKAPWRGMLAEVDGIQDNRFNTRGGAAKWQLATIKKVLNGFYSDLKSDNVHDLFLNLKDRAEEVSSELFEEGASKDKDIKLIAKAIKKSLARVKKLLNKSGVVNIGELMNYVIKQMHNAERMRSATGTYLGDKRLQAQFAKQFLANPERISQEMRRIAFERWRNTILPELNTEKVFGTLDKDSIEKDLQEDYDSMSSGEFQVYSDDTEMLKPFKASSFAKKLEARRKYIFKNGKGWYKYQQQYGYGSFQDQFTKQLWDSARQVGLMEKFGPQSRSVYDTAKEQTIAKNKTIPNIRKKFRLTDNTMLEIEGKTRGNPDNLIGKLLLGAQAIRSSTLGTVVLSSLGDLGMRGAKVQSLGGSYLAGEAEGIGDLFRASKDVKELGQLLGVLSEGTIGAALSRFSSADSPFSSFAKLNSLAYKFNFLQEWDTRNRVGWGAFIARRLGGFADLSHEQLPEGYRRTLTIHGIGEKEWDLTRAKGNRVRLYKNQYLVVPEVTKHFTKESVAKFLDKPVAFLKDSEFDDVKENMETKWYNYHEDESSDVIANPSVSTQAMINQGTRGDELKGRILRMLGQFQGFNIESTRRTLGRYIYGSGAENLYQSFSEGKADISGMVQFMLQQTKWGYISAAALNLSNGLRPPDPTDPKTFVDSFERGGSGWIYFSLLSQTWNKYNRDMGDMVLPRAFSTIKDFSNFAKALVTQNHPLFAAAKLAQHDFAPFGEFYTRLAINHLFLFGLMESSKPGYLRRLQSLAEKDGDKYLLSPTEHTNLF